MNTYVHISLESEAYQTKTSNMEQRGIWQYFPGKNKDRLLDGTCPTSHHTWKPHRTTNKEDKKTQSQISEREKQEELVWKTKSRICLLKEGKKTQNYSIDLSFNEGVTITSDIQKVDREIVWQNMLIENKS